MATQHYVSAASLVSMQNIRFAFTDGTNDGECVLTDAYFYGFGVELRYTDAGVARVTQVGRSDMLARLY